MTALEIQVIGVIGSFTNKEQKFHSRLTLKKLSLYKYKVYQTLIFLYLFTDCFMKISLQSRFGPTIGEISSWNSLQTNTDTTVIFVHKAPHWALYHVWLQKKKKNYMSL